MNEDINWTDDPPYHGQMFLKAELFLWSFMKSRKNNGHDIEIHIVNMQSAFLAAAVKAAERKKNREGRHGWSTVFLCDCQVKNFEGQAMGGLSEDD